VSNIKDLRRGDNDDKKIWGGSKKKLEPEYTVKHLQTDLQSVGVYSDRIDGDFGKITERALKIYQWCVKNSIRVIKNKILSAYVPKPDFKISGKLDSSTHTILTIWLTNKYVVTGDLIRVSFNKLSNIGHSPTFKNIGQPIVNNTEFVVSKIVFNMIELMNKTAKNLSITIKINQALRKHGVKVTGSVVPPATKSQHLIGHAIDCNIVDGSSWNTSTDFKKKKQTENSDKFIMEMKKNLYRWGGNFSHVDTPHFDKQLNANSF